MPLACQPVGLIHRRAADGPTQPLDEASDAAADMGYAPVVCHPDDRRIHVAPDEQAQLFRQVL